MADTSINKYNVATIQQSGKVGTIRYYQRNGETYVRSAHNSVKTNPRTDRQMLQRLKFASKSALWSAMQGNLANGFTNKKRTQSDFNAFMQLNSDRGVYFTKGQMVKGAQVIFPVQITDGRLESISTVKADGHLKSSIALGELVLDADTTVNDFANAVVGSNADFEFGDEIAFISILQSVNGENIPKVRGNFYRIVLTRGDSRLVHDLVSADGFQSLDGYLGSNDGIPEGCFAYVHTRRGSTLMVSSQTLVSNNADMIALYTSDLQYELARDSYGASEKLFLDPNSLPQPSGESGFCTIGVALADGCTAEMGSVSGGGSYERGSSAVIRAVANAGYTFVKWDDDNTSAERTITVNGDREYQAYFVADSENQATLTLTCNETGGATFTVNGEAYSAPVQFAKGTEVTVVATPASGYSWIKWSDNQTAKTRTLTLDDDTSLQAVVEEA